MSVEDPSSTHPSSTWKNRAFASFRGTEPVQGDRFAELMSVDRFPRSSRYDPTWVWGNHMGPNVLWLTEALTEVVHLEPGMRVLDMGCGTALSSVFLAREFGVEVWATDLWVPAAENFARIREAGLMERVYAIHAEARAYPFQHGFFDAAVSVDSYHYWGCDPEYAAYVSAFLKPGGTLGIVVPGDATDGVALDPMGNQITTFHSGGWWRSLWERAGLQVTHAELLDGGWDLWWRFVEAGMAWAGSEDPGPDAPMLEANRQLGFTRAVATRPH